MEGEPGPWQISSLLSTIVEPPSTSSGCAAVVRGTYDLIPAVTVAFHISRNRSRVTNGKRVHLHSNCYLSVDKSRMLRTYLKFQRNGKYAREKWAKRQQIPMDSATMLAVRISGN